MSNPTKAQMHIDRALTNMSVAFIQQASAFIADKIFPIVPVQKQSDRYFAYDKGDWYRDEAEERAPATQSAGGGYDLDNTPTYFCRKYAYHKDLTEEDRANSDAPLNPDQDATEFVTQKLLIRRERLWAANYFTTGKWGTDLAGVSAAPGGSQFLQWNDANSTPITDIKTQKTSILGATGFEPNTLVLGVQVYDQLAEHPDVVDKIKYTQKGILTPDLLAGIFDVPRVFVAKTVYNSAARGATDAVGFVHGKAALLCYSAPRPALKMPSAGYTFAWTGLLGSGAFANRISRIQMPWLGEGTERIEGEMAFDMKVVAADLGVFFNTAVA